MSGVIPGAEIDRLKGLLNSEGGMMLVEGDGASFRNYSSPYAKHCDAEKPKAVFVPKTENGLREVIVVAAAHGAEVVVTTMRLNQNCLSATTGYMINMRLFNKMEMEMDKMRVRVGAGTFIDEVAVWAQGHGEYHVPGQLATWGSSVGPIFGGGFEWHTAHAWGSHMADDVLEFRIMDSKGKVRTASEDENSDLFWALRGGGGQLGAVIEVVKKLHERPEELSGAFFILPFGNATNPCKKDCMLEAIEQVGRFQNSLGDNIGTFSIIGLGKVELWATCTGCDLTATVQKAFPGAVAGSQPQFDFSPGTKMSRIYGSLRHVTGPFINGYKDVFAPLSWDEVNGKYPVHDLAMQAYFFTEYHPSLKDVYSDMFAKDVTDMAATVAWTSYLGDSLINDIDSASSVYKGARTTWAVGSLANHEEFFPIYNRGMAKVPTVKASYWNYKNKYTSEEFSFGPNLEKIRAIRKKYDPAGFFALPARKNMGSDYISSCFAPYHCSGHGQLTESSLGEMPTEGCKCDCDEGWYGDRCSLNSAPTTSAPTTSAPTTSAPTTSAPTTSAPEQGISGTFMVLVVVLVLFVVGGGSFYLWSRSKQ